MKVNVEELIKKRFKMGWAYEGDSPFGLWNSITDEMVDEAVSRGEDEFAIILSPPLLKRVRSECKFPKLKDYFVTGIFDLENPCWCYEETRPVNNGVWNKDKICKINYHDQSLITYSKNKPKKIRICACPIEKEKGKKWQEWTIIRKSYYKDLETYINTSKIPDSLRSYVNEISYADYREEVFDVRYYSKRFLRISQHLSAAKRNGTIAPLKDLVTIFHWQDLAKCKDDRTRWSKTLDYKLEQSSYPLNENGLDVWKVFYPVKKGDIVVSYEGNVYLFAEDSKIVVSPLGNNAVLRLKSTWVTPEYLFLYMNSGKIEDVNYMSKIMLHLEDCVFPSWAELEQMPVFFPKSDIPMALDKKATQKYVDIFNQKYRPYLVAEKELDVVLDEVVPEEMKGDSLVSDSDANERIIELMREMYKAISCQIYNGAVILMGSILEAFFTDWWGNIVGGDYFRDPVCYEFIHGKEQPFDLTFREAIDKVLKRLKITKRNKDIREKIEKIRAMRDEIHTRVYLKHGNKMTKSICESALKDLEEIIRLRYYNFQMDSFMETIAIE